jgi:hypothetical protein
VSELPVTIVPVSELALCKLAPFLGFQAERRDWPRFKAFQANFFACLVTETIATILKSTER